jgi:hypothetical protein
LDLSEGFDAITIEGCYSAWKEKTKRNNNNKTKQVANTDVFRCASLIFPYFISETIPVSIRLSKNV